MKIRCLLALVGLVIGFALPTFAQQKETVDPQTIQQLAALPKKFAAAFNNNDAAALAALYTEDAVLVNDSGPIYGRGAIEKFYVGVFKQVHFSNQVPTPSSPHIIGTTGNEMWWNGEWSNTIKGDNWGPIDQKGYFADIVVREGDDWKVRLDIWNVTPPPTK